MSRRTPRELNAAGSVRFHRERAAFDFTINFLVVSSSAAYVLSGVCINNTFRVVRSNPHTTLNSNVLLCVSGGLGGMSWFRWRAVAAELGSSTHFTTSTMKYIEERGFLWIHPKFRVSESVMGVLIKDLLRNNQEYFETPWEHFLLSLSIP